MPIKGVTDNVARSFPSLGTLRKGAKKTDARRPGQDLETFRFSNEERPDIERAFVEAYGENPSRLSVYFMYDDIDAVWSAWMEEWVAGGLKHRCDGEAMVLWQTKDGNYSTEPRPCPYHEKPSLRTKQNPGCRQVGRLKVLLPGLLEKGFVGDVTLTTSSIHDIRSIQASLETAYFERQANGLGLRGIEFLLRRELKKISTPGTDGKRVRREKWLVTIAPAPRWIQHQLDQAEQAQMGLLPATTGAPIDDEDVEEGEFAEAPETTEANAVMEETGEVELNAAEQVKVAILRDVTGKYSRWQQQKPTKEQLGLLNGKLNEASTSANNEQGRKLFLEYVFGVNSSKELNKAQVGATLKWLVKEKDEETGDYPFYDSALDDFNAVLRQALIDKGQADMFDDADDAEYSEVPEDLRMPPEMGA